MHEAVIIILIAIMFFIFFLYHQKRRSEEEKMFRQSLAGGMIGFPLAIVVAHYTIGWDKDFTSLWGFISWFVIGIIMYSINYRTKSDKVKKQ